MFFVSFLQLDYNPCIIYGKFFECGIAKVISKTQSEAV